MSGSPSTSPLQLRKIPDSREEDISLSFSFFLRFSLREEARLPSHHIHMHMPILTQNLSVIDVIVTLCMYTLALFG